MQQMTQRIAMDANRGDLFGNASLAPMQTGFGVMSAATLETVRFVSRRFDRNLGLQRSLAHCEDPGTAYGRLASFWQQAAQDYLGYFQSMGTMPFEAVERQAAQEDEIAARPAYGGQTGD